MRKISLWLFILVFMASLARAQDAATQQLIDEINGRIQNLTEMQAAQGKKIADLEKQISDLSDKLNQPAASADDLKKLAEQVKDLAKKQQDDNDLVLKELEKLGKGGSISATSHKAPDVTTPVSQGDQTSASPPKGYYYTIASGDTVSAIAKAYRDSDKHVKVYATDILKANPGLNPNKMIVGKTIFIPDPNAK